MIFEITNPSDAYTIEAGTLEIAAAATLILGEGKYGLTTEDGERAMPVFLLGGHEPWLAERGMSDLPRWIEAHQGEIATALESVTIGSFEDRARLERMCAVISDPGEREKARAVWHDERRSSLNDIGRNAKAYARHFRRSMSADAGAKS